MKSLMLLLQCVLQDMETLCCTSTTRDWKTITSRTEHEGVSFLTITLPTYARDLERALELGMVTPDLFASFAKWQGLPRFLGGFLECVFDRSSGRLLDDPSIDCIFAIRQITLLFKKVLIPCSSARNEAAFDKYVECEKEVSRWTQNVSESLVRDFDHVSDVLWSSDLCDLDLAVYDCNFRLRHGPGKTADGLYGNAKFDNRTWTRRLEGYFPSSEFLIPNWGFSDSLRLIDYLEPEAEQPVKVVTVPKTLKTPRIIAMEPTCMQYAQQALMHLLVEKIEGSDYLRSFLGFTDQIPNQEFAKRGSLKRDLATLDLSEASDRVSNLLVQRLIRNFPHLGGALAACRSTRADVPGYGVMPLAKFASMGSAVCFPVEAMVFLSIIFVGIQSQLNRPLSRRDVSRLSGSVRVYGDDIIVPVEYVRSVITSLEAYGLKVNVNKSFWNGKFRESCGKDYYDGEDVTVTYCRRLIPTKRSDVQAMVSCVSLRNQLYKAGLWKSARYLDTVLEKIAPLPVVLETSPVVGRHSFLGYNSTKLCPHLHVPIVKGLVLHAKAGASPISGVGALLKFFTKIGDKPIFDPKHLERYGRPEHVGAKVRWSPAI